MYYWRSFCVMFRAWFWSFFSKDEIKRGNFLRNAFVYSSEIDANYMNEFESGSLVKMILLKHSRACFWAELSSFVLKLGFVFH